MSQELVYTSAPRGLKPGSRGFCTVLSTQGMPAPLAATLEGLSGYRPLFPPADARAADNPVVWSHLKVSAVGRTIHLLSRIADCGLDYSNRTNKLAHHIALDANELLAGGPANLLRSPGLLRSSWSDDPRVVPPKTIRTEPTAPSGICTAWKAMTGDAGWAGVLAESFLADPERVAILLFAPGQDMLPLFAEAISLLPADQRWNATFSTYFTALAPGVKCVWRAMIHDSKEAHESLRLVNALRIDLTSNNLGPATGGPLVAAARTGVRPHQSPPRLPTAASTSPPPIAPQDDVVFEGTEDVGGEDDDRPIEMAGVPDLPVRMAHSPTGHSPGANADNSQARQFRTENNSARSSSRNVTWGVAISLISILAVVGLLAYFGAIPGFNRRTESADALVEGPQHNDVSVQTETPQTASRTHALGGETQKETTPNQSPSDTVASNPPDPANTVKEAQAATPVAPSATPPAPAETSTPPAVTTVTSPASPAPIVTATNSASEFVYVPLPTKGKPAELNTYALPVTPATPGIQSVNAPKMQLFKPSWIPFVDKAPGQFKSNLKADHFIVSTGTDIKEFAYFTTIVHEMSVRYLLKSLDDSKTQWLAWYVVVCEQPGAAQPKLIRFMELPLKSDSLPKNVGKQPVDWLLPASAVSDDTWKPKLILGQYSISFAGKSYSLLKEAVKHSDYEWHLPLSLIEQTISQSVGNLPISANRMQLRIRLMKKDDVLSICSGLNDDAFLAFVSDEVRKRFDAAKKELVSSAMQLSDAKIDPFIETVRKHQFSLKSEPQQLQDSLKMLSAKIEELQGAEKDEIRLKMLTDINSKSTAFDKVVKQLAEFQKAKRDLSETMIESAHIYYEVFNSKEKKKLPVDVVKLMPPTNQGQPAEEGAE